MVLPVNGTREGTVRLRAGRGRSRPRAARAHAKSLLSDLRGCGAARGCRAVLSRCAAASGFHARTLTRCPTRVWQRCQVLFCAVPAIRPARCCTLAYLKRALELAERYDFVIAADECYAEIYSDETAPPPSLLQACMPRAASASSAAWYFTACPSARAFPACAPVSSPATRPHRALPSLSHLPRQRDAGADPAGEHRRLER